MEVKKRKIIKKINIKKEKIRNWCYVVITEGR